MIHVLCITNLMTEPQGNQYLDANLFSEIFAHVRSWT